MQARWVDGVLWVPVVVEVPGVVLGDSMVAVVEGSLEFEEWVGSALPEEELTAAFDPSKHPKVPGGNPRGGQWASKAERDLALREQRIRDVVALTEEAANAGEIPKSDTYFTITSPFRRSENAVSQVLALMDATGGDIQATVRALDSQADWQGGWYAAGDEWNAASALGGSGVQAKVTSDIAGGRPPLSENDVKAFEARRRWHQDEFRRQYPDGLDVYRGVTGKVAMRPYVAAIEEQRANEGRLYSGWSERYRAATFEQQNEMSFRTEYGQSSPFEAPQYQLSSWTSSQADASDFAYGVTRSGRRGGKTGAVVMAHVTADDVWLLPRVGVESVVRIADASQEVVVLNPTSGREAVVVGAQ